MSIGMTWTGWDGSRWDLQNGQVHLAKGGLLGIGMLDSDTFVQETALVDGQRLTGWRAKSRTILFPVIIGQGATALEWLNIERAFWNTMRPDKVGTFKVTAPDGKSRTIDARFVDDGGYQPERDPSGDRLSAAVINMVADDPWWVGDTFTQSFSDGTVPANFFGGSAGYGPPFIIGSANTLGTAFVSNPGDVDVWPIYYIDGPATSFSVQIDDKEISGTLVIGADQQLRIETAQNRQVAYMVTGGTINPITGAREGGVEVNVTKTALAHIEFTPIHSGQQVVLEITLSGPGKITLAGEPRYFKAW